MKSCLKGSKYTYYAILSGKIFLCSFIIPHSRLSANIMAFITGVSKSWSSPVLAILKAENLNKNPLGRKITDEEDSWIGSLASLGGVFGPIIYTYFVSLIGRKKTFTMLSIPFLIAYLLAAFADNVIYFYYSRFLMGVGTGGTFCITTIYVVETAEKINRGFFLGTVGGCMMLGVLFSYSLGPYVSIKSFNLILSGICVIFVPIFWLVAPETPYYLVSINKNQKAYKILKYLRRRSKNKVQKELKEIVTHLTELKPASYSDIFKIKGTRKAFFYGLILTSFQQFSGITVVLYFTESIFKTSGSNIPADISAILIGLAQFFVAMISSPLYEIVGRKILLLVSVTGAAVSQTLLGIYFFLQNNNYDVSYINWLPLFSLVMYISFFNVGMGAIPWGLLGEMLPFNVIAKAIMIVTSCYWFLGFFLTKYFGVLTKSIGMAGSFWFYAGFCVLFDLFVYFFVFETKGKSLAEIQAILNS